MKKGFSLAEVLIALGIIGTIAAVTMPTLNNNIWKGQRGPLLKNAYERINNAFSIAIQEDLGYTPKCANGNSIDNECKVLGEAINTRLRVTRECNDVIAEAEADGEGNTGENPEPTVNSTCQPTYNISGGFPDISKSKTFYFQNGMSIINYNSEKDYFSPDKFVVDTNGMKGPNKWGQDLFVFTLGYARNGKTLIIKPSNDNSLIEDFSSAKGATAEEILRNKK